MRNKAAWAWTRYESKLAFLNLPDEAIEKWLVGYNPFAFALLENHYMANRCFLQEGQLLKNAGRIADIPTVIVNGRYDVICPPYTAYRLHAKLPKSKLVIVDASGHSSSEPASGRPCCRRSGILRQNDPAAPLTGGRMGVPDLSVSPLLRAHRQVIGRRRRRERRRHARPGSQAPPKST